MKKKHIVNIAASALVALGLGLGACAPKQQDTQPQAEASVEASAPSASTAQDQQEGAEESRQPQSPEDLAAEFASHVWESLLDDGTPHLAFEFEGDRFDSWIGGMGSIGDEDNHVWGTYEMLVDDAAIEMSCKFHGIDDVEGYKEARADALAAIEAAGEHHIVLMCYPEAGTEKGEALDFKAPEGEPGVVYEGTWSPVNHRAQLTSIGTGTVFRFYDDTVAPEDRRPALADLVDYTTSRIREQEEGSGESADTPAEEEPAASEMTDEEREKLFRDGLVAKKWVNGEGEGEETIDFEPGDRWSSGKATFTSDGDGRVVEISGKYTISDGMLAASLLSLSGETFEGEPLTALCEEAEAEGAQFVEILIEVEAYKVDGEPVDVNQDWLTMYGVLFPGDTMYLKIAYQDTPFATFKAE